MNFKTILRVFVVVLAALALTALAAYAQDAPAVPGQPAAPEKAMSAVVEMGESASPAANPAESEPNNSFAAADVMHPGDIISGKIGGVNDRDFYRIDIPENQYPALLYDIDAQVNGSALDAKICLYSSDHTLLSCNDDSDGLDSLLFNGDYGSRPYYLVVQELNYPNEGGSAYTYRLAVYRPLLISATKGGTVAGIKYQPADVLAHYDFADGTQKWMMFFDASDVGITKNIVAVAAGYYGPNFHFVMAASQPLWIFNDELRTVTPYQIVYFFPGENGHYGPSTWGEMWVDYDGNTYGLSGTSEKIDALAYEWWVSTAGAATFASSLAAKDEDISNLPYGELYFDGSQVPGLAAEDVIGADASWGEMWYLTILGGGVIDGQAFTQKDIFMVEYNYNLVGLYWHGPDHGFNGTIDAFDAAD